MNWNTLTEKNREVLTCGDFKIIPCKNGKSQLREGKRLCGTFTGEDAAKAHAAFIVEQRTPKPAPKATGSNTSKRKLILGFSACAVLKALGKVGVKYPEADAILKRHGIEMPKASVNVQLGFGRNPHTWQRHGQPAPLTDEQIDELGVSHA
ncbi:MAG: hypothetical protein V2I43_27030 [Parvularcula sp.]|jgi:hypothetical protein|nr:hypothetical protein [Parvularcula sp.]